MSIVPSYFKDFLSNIRLSENNADCFIFYCCLKDTFIGRGSMRPSENMV